jgi:KRAB domain-containing zinc finger protein
MMKLQNTHFKNGKLLEMLNALTYNSNLWDTTLVCKDGSLRQNRLISFLIMPLLFKTDLTDIIGLDVEENADELTFILPDFGQTEVVGLVQDILKISNLKILESGRKVSEYVKPTKKRSSEGKRKQVLQHECEDCNDNFITKLKLKQHIETIHASSSDYCESCDFRGTSEEVERHVFESHTNDNDEGERLYCHECEYTTAYKQHLKQHVNFVHRGIGHLCDHCGFKARDKGQLKNHVLANHKGVRHECQYCDFKAKSKGNLKQHLESLHEGIRHRCDLCEYSTPYMMNLKNHIKVAHEGFRYECDMCDHKATSNGRLKTHKQVKHEGIRYSCSICQYKGTVKASLKRHMQAVHQGVRYPCSHCEYKATSRQHLKIHVESMHQLIRYPCDQCAFQATTRGHLKTHIKTHHETEKISSIKTYL